MNAGLLGFKLLPKANAELNAQLAEHYLTPKLGASLKPKWTNAREDSNGFAYGSAELNSDSQETPRTYAWSAASRSAAAFCKSVMS